MKRSLLLFLLSVLPLHVVLAQQTVADSLVSGGLMRHYNLYIPKNYVAGSSRPLVIHFHGYSSSEVVEQLYTNYMAVADTAGFLVAYPRGTVDGSGNQYWNAGIPGLPTTPDDVAFTADLIDRIYQRNNIDRTRVFASGLSNGGYMCYRLAWKLPNRIAAIASVSGSMSPQDFIQCNPTQPVPVMEIHGTADQTVPYTTSVISTDIDTLMRFWVLHDRCLPISDPIMVPNKDTADGTTVTHFEWTPELINESVELYRVNGGQHVDWPGAGAGNNGDFSATPTIWQFFNRFVGNFSDVREEKTPSASFDFYPNPSTTTIHIQADPGSTVSIMDMAGRTLLVSRHAEVAVDGLLPGVYFLECEAAGIRSVKKMVKF
jgi:polyhydroxybutyrate depolymerase